MHCRNYNKVLVIYTVGFVHMLLFKEEKNESLYLLFLVTYIYNTFIFGLLFLKIYIMHALCMSSKEDITLFSFCIKYFTSVERMKKKAYISDWL